MLTSGGRPAFFMDVITCGQIDADVVAELVDGIAEGCRQAGCALLGGETAEHPDMMRPGDFDLAGFCVAIAERRELVSGSRVEAGDAIVGLPSSGPHANGFSLVRRLLERAGAGLDDTPDALGGASVADALLEPTRIYARPVGELTPHGRRAGDGAHHRRRASRATSRGSSPTASAPRSTSGRGRGRRCSTGWRRSGSRRTSCGGCSTSASGFAAVIEPDADAGGARGARARRLPGLRRRQRRRGRGGALPLRVGVLISGEGTNLQALIDAPDIDVAVRRLEPGRTRRGSIAPGAPASRRWPRQTRTRRSRSSTSTASTWWSWPGTCASSRRTSSAATRAAS